MSALRELAARVSNWGRWGADDERGTVNFITPEVVRRGAQCVRRGQVFSLGLSIGAGIPHDPEGFRYNDDMVTMPLQCATQWDGLAHVYYGGKLYNGFPASTVTAAGAARNAIDKLAAGIVSRGVLLDVARLRGVARLAPGEVIGPADLEAAERAAGVRVERGDVLLVRTGHLGVFTEDGDREGFVRRAPGLGVACVEWMHAREIAAVATDTYAVEVIPFEDPKVPLPVHQLDPRHGA